MDYNKTSLPIMSYEYAYDDLSRISAIKKFPALVHKRPPSFTAQYNADNTLSSYATATSNILIDYDADGNLLKGPSVIGTQSLSDLDLSPETSAEEAQRLLDEANSITYDARGNLQKPMGSKQTYARTMFPSPTSTRLGVAPRITYSYDAENVRITMVEKLETAAMPLPYASTTEKITKFTYNRSGELPQVLIKESQYGPEFVYYASKDYTYYVYGPEGLSYEVSYNATSTKELDVKYYHSDHLGSTIALSDTTGTVTDRYSYDVSGLSNHIKGNSSTPFLYVGAYGVQTDPNGLINMRARYYDPHTQRFLTADPSGFSGGLNWYLYANGNPLMYVDIDGEDAQMIVRVRPFDSDYAPNINVHTSTLILINKYDYYNKLNPNYRDVFVHMKANDMYRAHVSAFAVKTTSGDNRLIARFNDPSDNVDRTNHLSFVTYNGSTRIPMDKLNEYLHSVNAYISQPRENTSIYSINPRMTSVVDANCNSFTATAAIYNGLQISDWSTFTIGNNTLIPQHLFFSQMPMGSLFSGKCKRSY